MTDRPANAPHQPRYAGVRTFAGLPHVSLAEAARDERVDAAILGAPFDTATSFRPGARFGPEAIRSASALVRPYHPTHDINVFETLTVVDGGDLAVTPGNAQRTAEQLDAGLRPLITTGGVPLVLGGDHSVVLGELRAQAAVHGPIAVLLLDAHADVWDQYYGERYFHGTPFRRAVEEGVIDPSRSLFAGMRGPLYSRADVEAPRELGFEVIMGDELRALSPGEYGARARARVGEGPAYLSFDIDVLDPAFAPGTGTPEIAGLQPREAIDLLRALKGLRFSGFDIVEVSPPYDGPGQLTALHAAAIAYELLALLASGRG